MTPRKGKKYFLALKKFFKKTPLNFRLIIILLFLLPGQNYYQTLAVQKELPIFQEARMELPPLPEYPQNLEKISLPRLISRSVVVIDVPSGVILYKKNPQLRLLPASTTKIMTALIALENYSLEQTVEVGGEINNSFGQVMGLFEGEKMTVENLLYGLLVQSGNDAAEALARQFPGGRKVFIQKMNEKARVLHLSNTHFANPTGIEEANHYTTAFDLAQMAVEALKNPLFAKIVATREINVSDIEGKNWHDLKNINQLLGSLWGIRGVKTGWTDKAGECLVAYIVRGQRKIVSVILGSDDRFGETEKLVNWVFNNFSWKEVPLQSNQN